MSRIAIVENYTLYCSGIRPVLETHKNIKVSVEARNITDLIPKLKQHSVDLIIIDVIHSEDRGIAAINKLKRKFPKLPVLLVINMDFADYFEEYIMLGVNGFAFSSKGIDELFAAVNALLEGEDYFPPRVWLLLKDYLRSKKHDMGRETNPRLGLTTREEAVLRLFCKGLTYKEIGSELNISPRTVETHKKNISTKINVKSTAELVEYAIQNKLKY